MSGTQINQQRQAVVASGTVQYSITTTCTIAGTLQDTGIFLLSILTPTDPKDDAFERVIEIADVDTYFTDRDVAIAAGAVYWRSSAVTITYTDIETANAAWKEFNSRINALVLSYDSFLTEFDSSPSGDVINFPTVDESAKAELKAAYAATVPLVTAAQDAVTAHQAECTQLETDLATTETQLQQATTDAAAWVNAQAVLTSILAVDTSLNASLTTNNAAIRSTNASSSATDPEQAVIEGYLVSNDAVLVQFTAQNTALAALISGTVTPQMSILNARVVSLTQAKNALFVDLNKCHIESSKLSAAATVAVANREAALAAVVAVCPDFTP